MKFSLFLLPVLSAFAAAAPAATSNDVAQANENFAESLVKNLTAQVHTLAAHMNQTVAALPANANQQQKEAAADSVKSDINQMTSAISVANDAVRRRQTTLGDLPHDVLGQLNGNPIVLAKLLTTLLKELDPALESVLKTLSLGELYWALQPLLKTELPTLLVGLGNLVNGLLAALSPLLSGLGALLSPIVSGLGL